MVASRQMADTSRTLQQMAAALGAQGASIEVLERRVRELEVRERALAAAFPPAGRAAHQSAAANPTAEIGRAPCRGRRGSYVLNSVGEDSIIKKKCTQKRRTRLCIPIPKHNLQRIY